MFNPLSDEAIRNSIREELERQPVQLMSSPKKMSGAGVYAIYYRGMTDIYAPISVINDASSPPIYAGKAEYPGKRKGNDIDEDPKKCRALASRLGEHARSIRHAENLDLDDFVFRYLVLPQTWIEQAETGLIRHYRPAWNRALSGFGNHGQGGGRNQQERSEWDTLHPGRPSAMKLPLRRDGIQEVRQRLVSHLKSCTKLGVRERGAAA